MKYSSGRWITLWSTKILILLLSKVDLARFWLLFNRSPEGYYSPRYSRQAQQGYDEAISYDNMEDQENRWVYVTYLWLQANCFYTFLHFCVEKNNNISLENSKTVFFEFEIHVQGFKNVVWTLQTLVFNAIYFQWPNITNFISDQTKEL